MHHAFINIQSYNVKQNLANFLWSLADISKLRGSSGQDYLICNSNLKTPVGSSVHCYRKEMFRIPQFLQVQEESIESHHHNPPVVQDHVEVEPEQQLKKVLMLKMNRSSSLDKISLLKKKKHWNCKSIGIVHIKLLLQQFSKFPRT